MGDYAPAGATGTCLHCPSDKFPRLAHTYCFRFPTGKFSPNAQSGSCQDCAVGTHAGPDAGQADCTACRSGKYQHITGQYYCIGCPEGKYQEFPGRTFCASCPTCEYSGNVATECYSLATACRVSHWSAWGSCDRTCAEGLAHRTRSVVVSPSCGGAGCPTLDASSECMVKPCDCAKVTCKFERHTCSDYNSGHATGIDWLNGHADASNKGNCEVNIGRYNREGNAATKNLGDGTTFCGHQSNGGLCSIASAAGCNDHSMQRYNKLVADDCLTAKATPGSCSKESEEYHNRRSKYWATCEGDQQSLRVYHSKDERKVHDKFVPDLTLSPREQLRQERDDLEGHHCKLVGANKESCNCRCHRMFRYNYMTGTSHVEKCDSATATHTFSKSNFLAGTDEDVCVTKTTAGNYDKAQPNYNPRSCNNKALATSGDLNNNLDMQAISADTATSAAEEDRGDKYWCHYDESKYDYNYHPKNSNGPRQPGAATPAPTAAPTRNPCETSGHNCDAVNGLCLMDSHTTWRCGCAAGFVLAADKTTCIVLTEGWSHPGPIPVEATSAAAP